MNFLFRKNKAWFVFYHYILLISGLFMGYLIWEYALN